MSTFVSECPRCRAKKITFDVFRAHLVRVVGWQHRYEVFSCCRDCNRTSTFNFVQRDRSAAQYCQPEFFLSANRIFDSFYIDGYLSLKDMGAVQAPEHTPEQLAKTFEEGAKCFSVGCFTASSIMFRSCLDQDTKELAEQHAIKGDLGTRLAGLFEQALLPIELQALSDCVTDYDEGSDLHKEDVEDIMDFVYQSLERQYSFPARIQMSKKPRETRKQAP